MQDITGCTGLCKPYLGCTRGGCSAGVALLCSQCCSTILCFFSICQVPAQQRKGDDQGESEKKAQFGS